MATFFMPDYNRKTKKTYCITLSSIAASQEHYVCITPCNANVIHLIERDNMKKIQCTFRLPVDIVDLIDEQVGETRTDKLLSLLKNTGEEPEALTYTIHEKLSEIECRLNALERSKPLKNNANSSNQHRKNQTIEFIKTELNKLNKEQISLIKESRYPLSEIRKNTNISKSQSDSYSTMIKETLNIKQ